MDKRNEDIVEKIKTQFEVLFRKNGYSTIDSFDYSVFFMKRSIKGKSLREYFEDSLNSTPQEDDDIIKFILMKSFRNSTSKEKRIYVSNFIDEIANQVVSLYNENERIESLINKYNAYEIVNTIDQNKIHFDKYEERTFDITKSSFKAYISKIRGMPHGDYKFSMVVSQKKNIDDNNDEQYEYKLNHVIQVKQDNNDDIIFDIGEYEFPSIEFFCNEDNQNGDFDSGTNLLSFQLKMENLNKTFSDSIQSEKFKFLELLIGNSKALMNNFQKIKTLEASLSLSNSFYDVSVGLVFNVEFDAITLMAVFNKISALLKNIISYKIRVEHKFKTILSYFEPISDDIIATLSPKKKDSGGCIIF